MPRHGELIIADAGVQLPSGDTLSVSESPWLIPIDIFVGAAAALVGTWTQAVVSQIGGGLRWNSSSAVNDSVSYDLLLHAGTWVLTVMGYTQNNAGIVTLQLDGVAVGAPVDLYTAAVVQNTVYTFTFNIATTAKHRLTLVTLSKNAASTAFQIPLQKLQLRRTA